MISLIASWHLSFVEFGRRFAHEASITA